MSFINVIDVDLFFYLNLATAMLFINFIIWDFQLAQETGKGIFPASIALLLYCLKIIFINFHKKLIIEF